MQENERQIPIDEELKMYLNNLSQFLNDLIEGKIDVSEEEFIFFDEIEIPTKEYYEAFNFLVKTDKLQLLRDFFASINSNLELLKKLNVGNENKEPKPQYLTHVLVFLNDFKERIQNNVTFQQSND